MVMKMFLCHWVLTLGLTIIPVIDVESKGIAGIDNPADPVEYINLSLQAYPIVCLAEGGHQANEPHQFLRRLLSDDTILRTVDVIIVEFASATHQAVLDAYVRGEDVPFATLSNVWRDTGQSPTEPWNSPLYHQLLEVIRNGNRGLPPGKKVRVIAGDPAIDWGSIESREDYAAARIHRDPYVAELAIEQAFHLDKTVLIIFGGLHLPRVPIAPEDGRNSLTYRILSRYPDTVAAISFLSPEDLGVEDRMDEFERGKVYSTDRHWVGEIGAGSMFPGTYSLVTDPDTGAQNWEEVPLYTEYVVRDLFDALIYLGPTSEWEYVPASFDRERDKDYLKELNRRSLLRFGRPLKSGRQ